jgi:hypothetical protein
MKIPPKHHFSTLLNSPFYIHFYPKWELMWLYLGKTLTFAIFHILLFSMIFSLPFGVNFVSSEDLETLESITGVPPLVDLTDPADAETNVALSAVISVSFSEEMNQTATQEAFEISPSVTGNFSWVDNTMFFTPQDLLASSQPYTVKITAAAKDVEDETLDGNKNGIEEGSTIDDHLWQFETSALPPQVVSVFPHPYSTMVYTDSKIIINFSSSMNTQSVDDTLFFIVDSQENPASTSGLPQWSDSDKTMTFTPFAKLQHNKSYIFVISYAAEDSQGVLFDGDFDTVGGEEGEDDYSWTFTTVPEPPKVLTVEPRKNEEDVEVDSVISVKFSKPMNQASVEDAFSFTHDTTNTTWDSGDCNITWISNSKVEFEPNFDLDHEKVYTVLIEATCQSNEGVTLDGNKNKKPEGLEEDSHDWSFTTIAPPPKIVSIEPSEGTQNILLTSEIVITFDKQMDTKSTEKAFTYTYEGSSEDFDTSSGLVTWTDNDKVMTFKPDTELEEGKRYSFVLENTAEDKDGIKFEGITWIYTTKINAEPELEGGGVHPEKGDTEETFTFTVVYSDEDDDEPEKIIVVIDGVDWKMSESDPTEDSFIEGKAYEWSMELDEGDHEYYFEVENEKHTARYPKGEVTRTLKVSAAEGDGSIGGLGEEIAGVPTMICGAIGIIIVVALILVVVMISKRGKARRQAAAAASWGGQSDAPTMSFMPADSQGDFATFDLPPEDDFVSFQTFDEEPPAIDAPPVMIQCPECGNMLKVKAARRPFHFPCKCGAKLVLK